MLQSVKYHVKILLNEGTNALADEVTYTYFNLTFFFALSESPLQITGGALKACIYAVKYMLSKQKPELDYSLYGTDIEVLHSTRIKNIIS